MRGLKISEVGQGTERKQALKEKVLSAIEHCRERCAMKISAVREGATNENKRFLLKRQ
jgi:hypothetical protein